MFVQNYMIHFEGEALRSPPFVDRPGAGYYGHVIGDHDQFSELEQDTDDAFYYRSSSSSFMPHPFSERESRELRARSRRGDMSPKFNRQWERTRKFLRRGPRKIIRFIHFHKVGGTGLCLAAQRNGELVDMESNCNSQEGLVKNLIEPLIAEEFAQLSCADQYDSLRIYSFVATETFLELQSCPQYFLYITNVRPPLERIQSHLTAHNMSASDTVKWLKGAQRPTGHLEHGIVEAFFDNYYIRFLLGPSVFYMPVGSITRDHLELAKRKLRETFAVVVPLNDQQIVRECLEPITRWYDLEFGIKNPNQGYLAQNASALDFLEQANSLDMELYRYAINISLSCKTHLIEHTRQVNRKKEK